jgi:hypothetical protein
MNPPAGGGGFGGRGGGGGGGGRGGVGCERPLTQWDTFCARPGEGTPPRAGAADAAAEGGGGQARGPEPENVKKIFDLIGLKVPAGGGRGGFGGFGAGGSEASTGQYLVTLKVGDKSYRQVLRIERVSGGDSGFSPFGGDDEDHDR